MNSNFLRLNLQDLGKGIVVAVLVVVIGAIQEGLNAHGLDLAAFDWAGIIDIGIKAGVAYLFKNLISTKDGAVLGMIGKKRD